MNPPPEPERPKTTPELERSARRMLDAAQALYFEFPCPECSRLVTTCGMIWLELTP